MRKILITFVIVIVCIAAMSILWSLRGRHLSLYLDRFKTIETGSIPLKSIVYEGSGTGGTLLINNLRFSLTPVNSKDAPPNIGTTKDEQLALSFEGKVFAFGPPRSKSESGSESLATEPQAGDDAFIEIRRSVLSWIEPFNFNFMTGQSLSWRRHLYYQLTWKKQTGSKLKMVWRYEQLFSSESNAWPTNESASGEGVRGLVRVDIEK